MAKKPQIVGAPINGKVVNQINYRAGVIKTVNDRSPEDLLMLNGSTAFVRLISGVGTSDEQLDEERRKAVASVMLNSGIYNYEGQPEENKVYINKFFGNTDLASKNILHGGSSSTQLLKDGIALLTKREGVAFSTNSNDNAAYQLYNDNNGLGFRPMPGITSITVTAFNRYGTLRKATVRFNCWTTEQLDTMEKLYMRPGFTMLLEWGHTYFINSKGSYEQRTKTLANEFFSGTTPKKIQEKITSLREDSGFNYDGFLGRVTNFSWTFRQDGGYDCSIDLVTQGEIIESVQALISPESKIITRLKDETATIADTLRVNPSTLHILLTVIASWPEDKNSLELQKRIDTIIGGIDFDLDSSVRLKTLASRVVFGSMLENVGQQKFIRLRDFLLLINAFVFRKTRSASVTSFNLDDSTRVNNYTTFDGHFSGNPGIAIIPTSTTGILFPREYDGLLDVPTTGEIEKTNVLDIAINTNFIISVLEGMIEARAIKDSKTFVYDLVQDVLSGISQALGDINDLDISYEDEELVWYVVDRNLPINLKDKESVRLNLTGLGSTTTQINLTTQLSSELSSMMAIGAGSGGAELSSTLEGFFRFNKGYVDRLYPTPSVLFSNKLKGHQQWPDYASKLKTIKEVYEPYYLGKSLNPDSFQSLSIAHQEWTNYTFRLKQGNSRNNQQAAPYAGIIPFKLQITLEGISGIKILECFTINKGILPPRYDNLVAFVATGLEHTVQDNRWYTTINAQMFIPPDAELKRDPQASGNTTQNNQNQGTTNTTQSAPDSQSKDLWTLVAISAAENYLDNPQGMADVAQSIYNRLVAGKYGRTIAEVITRRGQYEPTFRNPSEWKAITDKESAILAYKGSRNVSYGTATKAIDTAYSALTDPSLTAAAAAHVGSRTEFLAGNPTSAKAIGVVYRTPDVKNNNFYWRYRGKDVFYRKGILTAQSAPSDLFTV